MAYCIDRVIFVGVIVGFGALHHMSGVKKLKELSKVCHQLDWGCSFSRTMATLLGFLVLGKEEGLGLR